jgi:hypothetical protein
VPPCAYSRAWRDIEIGVAPVSVPVDPGS